MSDKAGPTSGFARVAHTYAVARPALGAAFFSRLTPHGVARPGQRVLDLGTGTGSLARDFAHRGCRVTGIDPEEALLVEARRANAAEVITVQYRRARAEATGFPDEQFDVVAAGNCWHWFDRLRVGLEAHRVLVRGGKLLIAHLDWQALPGNLVEQTEDVVGRLARDRPDRPWTFAYPDWTRDLAAAGFRAWEAFSYLVTMNFSHEAWRDYVLTQERVAWLLGRADLERLDRQIAELLKQYEATPLLRVEHRVFGLIAS